MAITIHKWQGLGAARNPVAALSGDDVQVWLGAVPANDTEVSAYTLLLDEPERRRADRFQVAASRNEFVFGRAMLRILLGNCLDIDPAMVNIGYGTRGKPRLEGLTTKDLNLHFNLAHSHSLVAIALALGREVGVDIEWRERSIDWPSIAGRIFSEMELCEMRALSSSDQELAFYHGWTRKEAYLKAIGKGLCEDISTIEVTFAPEKPTAVLNLPNASTATQFWKIHDLPLPAGYVGALVIEELAQGGRSSAGRVPEQLV